MVATDDKTARTVGRYLELPYHIAVMRDPANGNGDWIARVEELPGCEAHGDGPQEAAGAVSDAMRGWIVDALERGAEVPEPRRPSTHSGRLLLRLPQTLHAELAHQAELEETSLNGYITSLLAAEVGRQQIGASAPADPPAAEPRPEAPRPRFLSVAILANLVVVLLAFVAAVVLLVLAWQAAI
jgi:predicted RNase H-like HicB family nuclease